MKKEQQQAAAGNRQLQKDKEIGVQAVLDLLRKQAPLSLKQEKFCNKACVERFLKSKGYNVKKAAKHLRACLSWRYTTISIDNLMADEFAAELAEGTAYVAGHDEESRPVLVFRIKQDYLKFHSQKMLTRLVVFTLEVAIQTMPRNVEELVLLFDASFYRSASTFMNVFLATMKMVAEYYPGRLHKAFVIDPPSLFTYLWKGVRPFVELAQVTSVVSSVDMELDLTVEDNVFPGCRRAVAGSGGGSTGSSSLRFDGQSSTAAAAAKIGSCSSSRFTFTVSHHMDSLKPWYLSLGGDTSASKVGPAAMISPLNPPRSLSFASAASAAAKASPGASWSTPRGNNNNNNNNIIRKGFFPSTPMPQKSQRMDSAPRTPKPSFFQSPAMTFFRTRESTCHVTSKAEKCRESFVPFLKFYRRPYDEMTYRSKMRPPLGGLISIVPNNNNNCSQIKRRRHISLSQRY